MAKETKNPAPPKGEQYQERSIVSWGGFFSSLFSALNTVDLSRIRELTHKPWSQTEKEIMQDADIKSTMQSRLSAVPGKPWEILPADDSPEAGSLADEVKAILLQCKPLKSALKHLLKAIPYGHGVVEVVWQQRDDGTWVPHDLKLRRHNRFALSEDGSRILVQDSQDAVAKPVSDYKIIYHRNEPQDDYPFEQALLLTLFWPWFAKTNAWQFWMVVAEKWGIPSVLGKYPPHFTDTDVAQFFNALRTLQQDSVTAAPEGASIEILKGEPGEKGVFFRELLEFCEKQIAKAVLGGTLTQEVQQVGSYAASKTHMEVRQDIIEEDAELLQGTIDKTLIRWLVLFNYGEDAAAKLCPGIKFNITPGRGDKDFAETLNTLYGQGVRPPAKFYIDTFGLPPETKVVDAPPPVKQGNILPFE